MSDIMLIVGLGNPDREYQYTRHNVGFMAVDYLTKYLNFSDYQNKFKGFLTSGKIGDKKVFFLKPQTYMNNSGISLSEAIRFYKIPITNVIIFHDEVDLEFSKVKAKRGGGSAGHNGIKSIDSHAGKEYIRVRVGVGHPGHRDISNHVLGKFDKKEIEDLEFVFANLAKNIECLLDGDIDLFMNKIHEVKNNGV